MSRPIIFKNRAIFSFFVFRQLDLFIPQELKWLILDLMRKTNDNRGRKNVKDFACGNNQSFVIIDGSLYSTGNGGGGHLGLGHEKTAQFSLVSLLPNLVSVASGDSCTFVINQEGNVFATGRNDYGQLMLGDNVNRFSFSKIHYISNATMVEANRQEYNNSAFIIDSHGSLYGAGSNNRGQLSLGDGKDRKAFVRAILPFKVVSVKCFDSHTLALSDIGDAYSCGVNDFGQLGLGDRKDRSILTRVVGIPNIVAIACGSFHSHLLDQDGKLYSCGKNFSGVLGLGDNNDRRVFTHVPELSDIISITCSARTTFALTREGKIFIAGDQILGTSVGLSKHDYNLFTYVRDPNGRKAVAIRSGKEHILFLNEEGEVFGCGKNQNYQLGRKKVDITGNFMKLNVL